MNCSLNRAESCPKCGGRATWGYGYASGQGLGGYLMCEKCMYTLKFNPEKEMNDFAPAGPFWLVWNEQGRAPTYKHVTHESAKAEAERLAALNHGHRFHVLQLMGSCEFNAVRWTEYDSAIPF